MQAFPPIIGDTPRVLILGSMPSAQSLAKQQYYAHPQNGFWRIMQAICDRDDKRLNLVNEQSYAQRCAMLTDNEIAVWDVLADCDREGSLDKNIIRSSEKPNNFAQIFKDYPSLSLLGFNGGAAKAIFMRHCKLTLQVNAQIAWVQLPSTSPAHAAQTKQQKFTVWKQALSDY